VGEPLTLSYTKAALAFLATAPKKHAAQIIRRIEALAVDSRPTGAKRLEGVEDAGQPVWRERSGDYRILYCVRDGKTVVVLDIDHRKDVYRNL
jgi:mRNA interferase RelE/StbE